MQNTYIVKVRGDILVSGDSHADVKMCLKEAQLACEGSRILFLDIDKIIQQEEEEHQHPHG